MKLLTMYTNKAILCMCILFAIMQADPMPDLGVRRFSNSRSGFCGELCPETQPSRLDFQKGMGELYIILSDILIGITQESDIAAIDSQTGLILNIFDRITHPSLLISNNNYLYAVMYPEGNDTIHESALNLLEFPSGRLLRSWFPQKVVDFLIKDSSLVVSCNRNSLCTYNISSPDSNPSWEITFNNSFTGTIAESDNIVVVALNENRNATSNTRGIAAISLIEMKPVWISNPLPFENENIVIGDGLVFLRTQQELIAINLWDGTITWTISDSLSCDPAYHAGSLFYSDNQYLIEVSSETGKQRNSQCVPDYSPQTRNDLITLCTNGIILRTSWNTIMFFDYSLKPKWIYSGVGFSRFLPYNGTISGLTNSLVENP